MFFTTSLRNMMSVFGPNFFDPKLWFSYSKSHNVFDTRSPPLSAVIYVQPRRSQYNFYLLLSLYPPLPYQVNQVSKPQVPTATYMLIGFRAHSVGLLFLLHQALMIRGQNIWRELTHCSKPLCVNTWPVCCRWQWRPVC